MMQFLFSVLMHKEGKEQERNYFLELHEKIFLQKEREIRGVSEWVRESAIKREFVKFIWHEESNK